MANTSKRGFASMDAAKQREIASKGGRAAHAKGTAHEFTTDEARVAGRKGGEAVSRDRAHMSAIGREGGHSRGARARAAASIGSSNIAPSATPSTPSRTDFSRGTNDQFVQRANEDQSPSVESRNALNRGTAQPLNREQSTRDRGPSGRGEF
jgi:general stress protein YciG